MTEEEQKRVKSWEYFRFVYPNELGGIEDPWDENFMLTKEASKIWTGVQKNTLVSTENLCEPTRMY